MLNQTTTHTRPYRMTEAQRMKESFTYRGDKYKVLATGLTVARIKNSSSNSCEVLPLQIIEGMRIGLSQVELTLLRNSL